MRIPEPREVCHCPICDEVDEECPVCGSLMMLDYWGYPYCHECDCEDEEE